MLFPVDIILFFLRYLFRRKKNWELALTIFLTSIMSGLISGMKEKKSILSFKKSLALQLPGNGLRENREEMEKKYPVAMYR